MALLKRKKSTKKKTAKSEKTVDKTLINKILGGVILLFSVFVFLASISYLFSWRADQSILNLGITDFLFDFKDKIPSNFMGKLGAFFAHLFIYNGFGKWYLLFGFRWFVHYCFPRYHHY